MGCREVRELLAEHALGTLDHEHEQLVERHLAWCAGCRKEARELSEGAAIVGYALTGPLPPPRLEDRVTRAVSATAGGGRRRRPLGALVAAVLAGLLATGALGWAVAMTGKASRLEAAADTAQGRAARFQSLLEELLLGAGEGRLLSAQLTRIGPAVGGGRAILFDSPGGIDWVLVLAGGLPAQEGPYRAYLSLGGRRQGVGTLAPSYPGELSVYRFYSRDVSGTRSIAIVGSQGTTVLRGLLHVNGG